MGIFTTRLDTLLRFLEDKGAKKIPHVKNKFLYDHLLRVYEILIHWGFSEREAEVGLFHSVYSSQYLSETLVSQDDRVLVSGLIGAEAESLVFAFCEMDRTTFRMESSALVYESRFTGEQRTVEGKRAELLLHVLFANEIDHVTIDNFGYYYARLSVYSVNASLLKSIPSKLARSYGRQPSAHADSSVTYIAHSGFKISTPSTTIVIDPWLYPSDFNRPVLQGLDPGSRTIDYLIPEPKNSIDDLECDIILLSHFHTHHAPLREITEIATKRRVTIVCPDTLRSKMSELQKNLGVTLLERITFHFVNYESLLKGEEVISLGETEITVYSHTQKNHFAFLVTCPAFSVLHITDSVIHRNLATQHEDELWGRFTSIQPTLLCIGAAPCSMRVINSQGGRNILENTSLTPVQAAKITNAIAPTNVMLIGMDNVSVWSNRAEYRLPKEESASQFVWALSFLNPAIRIVRPGSGERIL